MFGHVLRIGNCTPAFQAFRFAVLGCGYLKGRRGRHRTNLFNFIINDLKDRSIYLKGENEFNNLVDIERDRTIWRQLFSKTN